jgi:uncharacterized protein YkwD
MRVIIVSLIAAFFAAPVHAETVWNVKVKARARDGHTVQLTIMDGHPSSFLPTCRCVAGMWRLGGETATHFVGTVEELSFNHTRKTPKSIRAKVRKTRSLMGVHKNYRPTLHGIMRASGQLVLREVAGGEWEVAGFADDAVGDLFKAHASWRAKHPKAGPATPLIDAKADATALADLINDYRVSIKLPRVPISPAMMKVAQAHAHDLDVNRPVKEGCNMHSWSDKGSWSSCCYDSSKEAARCMWKKPKEIAGYKGFGYEIAANASGMTPEQALSLWQNSPAHHAVMINKDQWKKPWRALGVAVEGDYAVAWFGEEAN